MTKAAMPHLASVALACLLAVAAIAGRGFAEEAAPRVVASIAPVHSLVARVMRGVGEPRLLILPGASPHHYALRPSEAGALAEAELVVWIGPELERQLLRPLGMLSSGARLLQLDTVPGLVRLPWRGDGADSIDPHFWLDPENARTWIDSIAATLGEADPTHRRLYAENVVAAAAELTALEREIADRIAPLRGRPFILFHDAFQYFERRFGIEATGVLTPADDRPPSPARVARIRKLIRASGARCLFRPPTASAALARTVVEGTGARVAVLDPIGRDLSPGPDLYPALMRNIAAALVDCLG